MSFSERLQKKLLPSTELYIKTIESRFKETLKQAQAIEKEIRTLENPRNIRAARKRSDGAYTQLLSKMYDIRNDRNAARNRVIKKVNDKLDVYQQKRLDAQETFADAKEEIDKFIKTDERFEKVGGPNTILLFKERLKTNDVKGPGILFALDYALQNTENPKSRELLLKEFREEITKQDKDYLKATGDDLTDEDILKYISIRYRDYARNTEQGQRNRESMLLDKNIARNVYYLGLSENDVTTYRDDFDKKIERMENLVYGRLSGDLAAMSSATDEQKAQFAQAQPGLTVENGRVIVDPDADVTDRQGGKAILDSVGSSSPTVDEFINSSTVRDAYAGVDSGASAVRKMKERVEELKVLQDQRLQAAAQEGRLSPAEISVLTNPLFTRTGFRGQSYGGYLAPRASATPTPVAAEPAAEPAEEVEEAPAEVDERSGSAGVPIIPAVINRFKKTYDRATTADDAEKDATHRELTDLVDGFKRLPKDIQDQFPRNFVRAVYEFGTGREGKDDSPEQQQMDFASAVKSLDDAAITTKTIGEYVADVGSDPNATALESTADMVEFLNHPDSVGEGSSVVGRNIPVGAIAFDFLDTMNQIGAGSASKSDLISVFEEARGLSQQDRPDFFDTDKYGRYESVDKFVAAMDTQSGGISQDGSRDMVSSPTDEENENRDLASVDPSDEAEPSTTTPDEVDSPGSSEEQIAADPGREQAIADFNARPGQAAHGSVFPVVSPESQETDDQLEVDSPGVSEEQIEESRQASLAQLEAEREDIPPTDRGTTVAGRNVPLEDSKPGPEDPSVRVDDVPVEPELTPDQQLAKVRAALPKGDTPRIDTDAMEEELNRERRKRSKDNMLAATGELFTAIDKGELSFDEAVASSNEMIRVYGDLVGPNYARNLFRKIDKAYNVGPGANPTRDATQTAKLSFVSPVATKDTIDGKQVITSDIFGDRPDPVTGKIKPHEGIDFRARLGEPIFAVADGVIQLVDRTDNDGAGLSVSIKHSDGSVTKYFHASSIDKSLKPGDQVKAGQEIMKAGKSGNVSAPHLHFELLKPNDQGEMVAVNPLEHMGGLFSDFVVKDKGLTVRALP